MANDHTISLGDADPIVEKTARLVGILKPDSDEINVDWFSDPLSHFDLDDGSKQQLLLELLDAIFGSTNNQAIGLPLPTNGDIWHPIQNHDGTPTGLYIIAKQTGSTLQLGLGAKWIAPAIGTNGDTVQVTLWGSLPLLLIDGATQQVEMPLTLTGDDAVPIQIAAQVTHSRWFGSDDLHFKGAKLAAQFYAVNKEPTIALQFMDVKLPNNVTLGDLALNDLQELVSIDGLRMALTLFVQQIEQLTGSTITALLDLLGLSGNVPPLDWPALATRGVVVFREWFTALLAQQAYVETWLRSLAKLFKPPASALPTVEGQGTRPDPYRVELPLALSDFKLYVTLASALDNGARKLYPGAMLSAEQALSGTIRTALEARTEFAGIPLTSAGSLDGVPSLSALIRLYDSAGNLVDQVITGDLAFLSDASTTLTIREARGGVRLANGKLTPVFELVDASCALGAWPTLDLSNADLIADAAMDALQTRLQSLFGTGENYTGKHLLALLGLRAPTAVADAAQWDQDVTLVEWADFIQDPLKEVGCYHTRLMNPAQFRWQYLMPDLVQLFGGSASSVPLQAGTSGEPWALDLATTAAQGAVQLRAYAESAAGGGSTLHVEIAAHTPPVTLHAPSQTALTFSLALEALRVDFPALDGAGKCPNGPVTATWIPQARASATLARLNGSPLQLTTPLGLTLSTSRLILEALWHNQQFDWDARADDLQITWTGLTHPLSLPKLEFGPGSPTSWDFDAPDLNFPELGLSLRVLIGQWLISHGGSFGFGLGSLLGLLPNLSGLAIPGWSGSGLSIDASWPDFAPPDWPAFFDNPFPALRLHLGKLASDPIRFRLALRWLQALFWDALPDLSVPTPSFTPPANPFKVTGSGTYFDPFAISINDPAARPVEALVWLESDPATRATPNYLGFGVRLTPPPGTTGGLTITHAVRLDLARVNITDASVPPVGSPSALVPLPRFTLMTTIRNPGGKVVSLTDPTTLELGWAELGLIFDGTGSVTPVVRLHDCRVDADLSDLIDLQQIPNSGALNLDAVMRRFMNELLAQLPGVSGAPCLLTMLTLLGLTSESPPGTYTINIAGWAALLADPATYLRTQIDAILRTATTRDQFLNALRVCLGIQDSPWQWLLGDFTPQPAPGITLPAKLDCVRKILVEFDLLLPASHGYAPNIPAWVALLSDPDAALQGYAQGVFTDEALRLRLLNILRGPDCFNLDDTSHPQDTFDFDTFTLDATASGVITLCIKPIRIGANGAASGLVITGCVTLNLAARTITATLRAQPQPLDIAIALEYQGSVTGLAPFAYQDSTTARLHWGEPLPTPALPPLTLYPPATIRAELEHAVPRFLLSAVFSAFFDTYLAANSAVTDLMQLFGLIYRAGPAAAWKLRDIIAFAEHPVAWLNQAAISIDGSTLTLPDERITAEWTRAALDALRDLTGLTGSPGTIQFPFDVRLAVEGSGSDFKLAALMGVTLPANAGTIDTRFAFDIGPQIELSGHVDARVNHSVDGSAITWGLRGGYDDQWTTRLHLAIDGTSADLDLMPFAGWNALVAQGARLLLPSLAQAIQQALGPSLAWINDLALLATVQVTVNGSALSLLDDPERWLYELICGGDLFDASSDMQKVRSALQSLTNTTGTTTGLQFNQAAKRVEYILSSANPVARITFECAGNAVKLGVRLENVSDPNIDAELKLLDAALTAALGAGGVTLTPHIMAHVKVRENRLVLMGQSIEPALKFNVNGTAQAQLYPFGDSVGTPDFRLDIPGAAHPVALVCEDGTGLDDCALALAKKLLVPMLVETVLDSPDMQRFLNETRTTRNIKIGDILKQAQILEDGAASGTYDVRWSDLLPDAPSTPPDPLDLLTNVLKAGLELLKNTELAQFRTPDGIEGALTIVEKTKSGDKLYGLNLLMPHISLSDDPEIVLQLGTPKDDAEALTWIADASTTTLNVNPGISLYLVKLKGTTVTLEEPEIDLVNVGIDVNGKADKPLIDGRGFRLEGVMARLLLSVEVATGNYTLGGMGRVYNMGIPLGSGSSDHAFAQKLLDGGDSGDTTPVNPAFGLQVAYVNTLAVKIEGSDDNEVWIPIQRTFGPISIEQIGVRWEDPANANDPHYLTLLIDGGAQIGGLSAQVDDLSVSIPISDPFRGNWRMGLRGLGIAYSGGGVRVSGALLETVAGERYDGLCLIEAAGRTFVALGAFALVGRTTPSPADDYTSMFVFVLLPIPLGGPPFFFVTGLAGGFGYNMGLEVPPIETLKTFPLLQAVNQGESFASEPMEALRKMGQAVPSRRGSYWLAAGVRFTTFELIQSAALLYLLIDRGLEIGLLGISQMDLPEGSPLVSIELLLKARFSSREGVLSVEALLTDNSWLLSKDCRLTGGFAFYVWFGSSPHSGDFVLTLGGYHPRFNVPAHYPNVPRLGFNWRVSSKVVIKGESYFALTTSAVMAGGLLEATYKSGGLRAWFKTWANFLISWKPFYYDIDGGVSVGAEYRCRVCVFGLCASITFRIELGASFHIYGPPFTGSVTVKWWVISFTVPFGGGADDKEPPPITWGEFRHEFLPANANEIVRAEIERGLLEITEGSGGTDRWLLQPEFTITTETVIASNLACVVLRRRYTGPGGTPQTVDEVWTRDMSAALDVDIRPMKREIVNSAFEIEIHNNSTNQAALVSTQIQNNAKLPDVAYKGQTLPGGYTLQDGSARVEVRFVYGNLPAALWEFEEGKLYKDEPEAKTIPALTGVRLVASIDMSVIRHTGQIDTRLVEQGFFLLPFDQELAQRARLTRESSLASMLTGSGDDSLSILNATRYLLASGGSQRRQTTLNRLASLGVSLPDQLGQPVTSAYLVSQRSAAPQVATLYDGMAQPPAADVRVTFKDPRDTLTDTVFLKQRAPDLVAVMRDTARARFDKVSAVATTVEKLEGIADMMRVQVRDVLPDLVKEGVYATLKRVPVPDSGPPAALANAGRVVVCDRGATAAQLNEFKRLTQDATLSLQSLRVDLPADETPYRELQHAFALDETLVASAGKTLVALGQIVQQDHARLRPDLNRPAQRWQGGVLAVTGGPAAKLPSIDLRDIVIDPLLPPADVIIDEARPGRVVVQPLEPLPVIRPELERPLTLAEQPILSPLVDRAVPIERAAPEARLDLERPPTIERPTLETPGETPPDSDSEPSGCLAILMNVLARKEKPAPGEQPSIETPTPVEKPPDAKPPVVRPRARPAPGEIDALKLPMERRLPRKVRPSAHDQETVEALTKDAFAQRPGVTFAAGTTLVWDIPARRAYGEMPELVLRTDQVLRITALSQGGRLLEDMETQRNGLIRLPEGTARVALTGLGRSRRYPAEPGMGAITLHEARNPVAAVGWQMTSELKQLNSDTFLARGAVVRTGAAVKTWRSGRRVAQAYVPAADMIHRQDVIETMLPPTVQTIAVIFEIEPGAKAADPRRLDIGLSVTGATLAANPLGVGGRHRMMLLYEVESVDAAQHFITVTAAAVEGWTIAGVVGLRRRAAYWAEQLSARRGTSLVEDGALNPRGSCRVVFLTDAQAESD